MIDILDIMKLQAAVIVLWKRYHPGERLPRFRLQPPCLWIEHRHPPRALQVTMTHTDWHYSNGDPKIDVRIRELRTGPKELFPHLAHVDAASWVHDAPAVICECLKGIYEPVPF